MKIFPLFFSTKYNQIKKFFKNVPTQKETSEKITFEPTQSYSYIDTSLTIEKKIELEKRRRHQAYTTLDYLLSVVSYFDFFSLDSFKIAKKAKELSQFFQKKSITSDLLLLPFFDSNPQIKILLERYGIHEHELGEIISANNKIPEQSFQTKTGDLFKNLLIKIDIPVVSEMFIFPKETNYSYEIHQIFTKAAENALIRFKTPVISSEILLITMLEAKKSKVGKLLKQLLKTETNWYMLRYSLMKRLHTQELSIRTDVPKNQQYFAYLLKTQLPEIEFDMLIEKDCLLPGVLLFRNNMVGDILKIDISEHLKVDILTSIKSRSKKRTYASLKVNTTSENLKIDENEIGSFVKNDNVSTDIKNFIDKNEISLSENEKKIFNLFQSNAEVKTNFLTSVRTLLKEK